MLFASQEECVSDGEEESALFVSDFVCAAKAKIKEL